MDFCQRRRLQHTFKATFSVYGQCDSFALVRSWCHKMEHFLKLERESEEGVDLEFKVGMVQAYVPLAEFTEMSERARGQLRGRCDAIAALPKPNKR